MFLAISEPKPLTPMSKTSAARSLRKVRFVLGIGNSPDISVLTLGRHLVLQTSHVNIVNNKNVDCKYSFVIKHVLWEISDMETSIALMADQLVVKFVEVLDRYPCNEDIECKYMFNNNYKIQDGDRIAIFKMGWNSLKNYILFEWAVDSSPAGVHFVIFSRFDLPNGPNEIDDLYQFCYISGENVVQGISTPFQIYSAESKSTVNLTDSLKNENHCLHLKQMLAVKDREILKLKEENAILKESIKALVDQRKFTKSQCYDEDINGLKEVTTKLKSAVLAQQKELESLKIEMKKDKAEYKNLLLEKIIAEKKFDAISGKKEGCGSKRRNFDIDLGSLQPLPPFPFQSPDQ